MMSYRLAADVEIFQPGEIGKDAPVLGHEAEAPTRDLERLELRDFLAEKADGSGPRGDQSHQLLERRRLAGAVAAHERDHLAVADVKRRLEQDLRGAITRLGALDLEHAHDGASVWGL